MYLKVYGYFFISCTAVLKSETISAHTNVGSEQSGLVGHHSRCFLDCKIPLGSRTNRTKRIPKLKKIIFFER